MRPTANPRAVQSAPSVWDAFEMLGVKWEGSGREDRSFQAPVRSYYTHLTREVHFLGQSVPAVQL